MIRRLALPLLAAALVAGCATPATDPTAANARYERVLESPLRTEQDRKMDASRHPAELLAFAQVQSGWRALDVAAGGGYTAQLIALAVGPNGTLWAQAARPNANLAKRLEEHPQANFIVVTRPFDDPVPPEATNLDLVTLVLNYHDITYLPVDRARMNQRIFAALKPGGRYVIVDHAGRAGTGVTEGQTLHRIDEDVVRREVLAAGFVLDGEGSFLRNPADPRTGSTNNPPVPTDKFALRFVKPR
ncbi:MAG: hypothetical protein U1F10_05280 [Burkholderiales bacterium]